ncbi:7247_t:CDS:1 [Racocetra fulgida]|uniref:7247_t:CDS:1 n=1 Tax=Racocetra fulgida TaxID=60492 RepID=A0A9N9I048_9GLOM|nr:7247_t:CDS:1 [Racocetra fulgida]
MGELIAKNKSLRNEAAKYSSELGRATNFEFGDHDSNNINQLLNDIKQLKNDLEYFCTLRKSYTEINEESMKMLAKQYGCSSEFSVKTFNRNLFQGLLQRHIIEFILNSAEEYLKFEEGDDSEHFEAKIISAETKLHYCANSISKYRVGTDKVSSAIPTKLRQSVYILLSNRGFSQINHMDKVEHPFIANLTKKIINKMNNIRTMKDSVKNKEIESMTTEIIRRIIVIFLFRFKVQEPAVQSHWFQCGNKIEPEFMDVPLSDEDLKNASVDACSFPLIATNLDKKDYKVILKASIVKANVVKEAYSSGGSYGVYT